MRVQIREEKKDEESKKKGKKRKIVRRVGRAAARGPPGFKASQATNKGQISNDSLTKEYILEPLPEFRHAREVKIG